MSNSTKKIPPLTSEQIKQIRELFDQGSTRSKTAKILQIGQSRVQRIVKEYEQEKHLREISRRRKKLEEFRNHPDRPKLIGSWEEGLSHQDIPALEYELEIFKRSCSIGNFEYDYGPGRYMNDNKNERKQEKLIKMLSCQEAIIKKFKSGYVLVNDVYVVNLKRRVWRYRGKSNEYYHSSDVSKWLTTMIKKLDKHDSVCDSNF
ncbi:hypothetical protein CMI37_13355 [Candidatus Pacearchaeota archaeon]|nr:hypothetical protein [Candidatus Pacearchaeota archaeon]|tara:strand:- start:39 stop:650 length:612 start_codon:yes stop_codon:yes gene_type:complete